MTLRSEEYWEARSRARMEMIQTDALATLRKLDRAYKSAEASMLVQIRAIVKAFAGRYGLSEEEAAEVLKTPVSLESYQALQKAIANMPDGVQKRLMMAELNAPSARYRISKTQAIREQTRAVCSRLAEEEKRLFTDSLTKSVQDAYLRTAYDLQNGVGLGWEVAGISNRLVNQLLREDWSGASYKTRISGRYAEMADELSTLMLEGFLGGRSRAQMEEELSARFDMNVKDARRLLVTETTYVTNAAQKQLYEDENIKEYRYQAVLDMKTSEICETLDGMVLPVKYAKPGKNYPPMHPNCRSTTIAVLSREWLATVTRKAVDPVTGELMTLPPNTSYKDWYRMLVEKHGQNTVTRNKATNKKEQAVKNEYLKVNHTPVTIRKGDNGVYEVGRINRSIYAAVTEDIATDEVIITKKQIAHVFEGHPEKQHAKVIERLQTAVMEPDYILRDHDPQTAVVFKEFVDEDERYRVILKLATANDAEHRKNSIITAFYISEKKWKKYLRNKEIVYSRYKL